MKDRFAKVALFLTIGWVLGYMHHHLAIHSKLEDLRNEAMALNARVTEMSALPPMKVKVKTTAYSNDKYSINVNKWRDGRTATNKVAQKGYVAADWGVFPPGTRFYIPGYGEAVVEDRGGMVKGNHLDLFLNSRDEALKWGVRNQDVYVLELGGQQDEDSENMDLQEAPKSPTGDVELAQRYPTQPEAIKAAF